MIFCFEQNMNRINMGIFLRQHSPAFVERPVVNNNNINDGPFTHLDLPQYGFNTFYCFIHRIIVQNDKANSGNMSLLNIHVRISVSRFMHTSAMASSMQKNKIDVLETM